MLYAPILPEVFSAVSTSGTTAANAEWKRPAWFITEAIAGLLRGIPAGVIVVPLAVLIMIVGVASAWRRDRLVTAIMLLPLGGMAALLMLTGHNMWPRFFFFGAGFAALLAVHGGFTTLALLVPRHANRIGNAALAAVVAGSLLLLPRAWAPKQDYEAAVAWITAHAAPGDAIVGSEMLRLPVVQWLGRGWMITASADSLAGLETTHPKVWMVYTFPIRLAATAPALWQRVQREYHIAHVVPATIGGGEIVIVVHERVSTAQHSPAPVTELASARSPHRTSIRQLPRTPTR
jgi:hypothetical protein